MIYTITFNPSLDLYLKTDDFKLNMTNRAIKEEYILGGKGLNVSKVLSELNIKSQAITFCGGFIGEEIAKRMSVEPYDSHIIKIPSLSRINIKLKDTEINLKGPLLKDDDIDKLFDYLSDLNKQDLVIISGKINGDPDVIHKLCRFLNERHITFILDNYDGGLEVLKYEPLLIKPNTQELKFLFKNETKDLDYIKYIYELKRKGAKNIIISLGKEGSLALLDGRLYSYSPGYMQAINTVGAGDSMIAGFSGGLLLTRDLIKAYHLAIACSNACVTGFSLPSLRSIIDHYSQITIQKNN